MRNVSSRIILVTVMAVCTLHASVERVWLTYKGNTPNTICINWETTTAGPSAVDYGLTTAYGQNVTVADNVTIHHVEIPLSQRGVQYHYKLTTGTQISADRTLKSLPATGRLRLGFVGNWWLTGDFHTIMNDSIDILLTGGDNVGNVGNSSSNPLDYTAKYSQLVTAYPYIFDIIPVMPTLGNHDHEVDLSNQTYDTNGLAFTKFFALSDKGWAWHLDIPEFRVRFIGLDANHEYDQGTSAQPCHSLQTGSQEYTWYKQLVDTMTTGFAVTLWNGNMDHLGSIGNPTWRSLIYKGSTGLYSDGYFAEQCNDNGRFYYNSSVAINTSLYYDPHSVVLVSTANYALVTLRTGWDSMRVEIKNLATGAVLQNGSAPIATTFGLRSGYVPVGIKGKLHDETGQQPVFGMPVFRIEGRKIVLDGVDKKCPVNVSVFTINGQAVTRKNVSGKTQVLLPVTRVPGGMYMVIVTVGDKTLEKKLLSIE